MSLRSEVEERLRAHGVRPTAQRVEIGMLLLAQPCHLSAEQLITRLRNAGSGISKATVYNTLNLFARQGIVREVAVDPSRLFYDSTNHGHHHFYNEDTGELIDIDPAQVVLGAFPEPPPGTDATSVELVIRVRNRR
ncbi:MAG: Fur family transcriptional regulator [Gammaproteobacteria bacterium]|nr:Fur family transcriptional regulator [Gammaproteobacteria bacterium]